MTTNTTRAMLTAVLLTTAAAITTVPASAASLSISVQNHLTELQNAMKKGDIPAAQTALAAARAVNSSNAYDNYVIARMGLAVDAKAGDMAMAAKDAFAAADSPAADKKEVISNQVTALELAIFTKDYPRAMTYAKTLQATNPTDPKVSRWL